MNDDEDDWGEGNWEVRTNPGILSTSNSTPSLARTNISFTKGTGMPLGNSWGFTAISVFSQFLSFCLLLRLPPLQRYQNPPPRCFDFGLGWEFTESDTSLKLFPLSDRKLQHLPAFRNVLECNLQPILFSYLSFFLYQSFFIFFGILFTNWETLSTKVTLVNRNSFITFCTNFTSIKSRKNEYNFFNIYLKS